MCCQVFFIYAASGHPAGFCLYTSATSVPTPAAPPAPVANMHWQPYHFIARAPEKKFYYQQHGQKHRQKQQQQQQEQEQPTPATTTTTARQQPTATTSNEHRRATRGPGESSPRTFQYGVVLVFWVLVLVLMVVVVVVVGALSAPAWAIEAIDRQAPLD